MPGGSSSRVLSRIQDHSKSPDGARSSHVDDEERAQSEPSSSKRKKSSSSSSSNRNGKPAEKGGVAVGGTLQEQVKDPQARSRSRSSSPAVVVRSAKENTPEWAKSLLLAQKASDVRLEKLEKVVHHGQKPSDESLSGHKFEKKLYEEQHDFSLKVLWHLQNVASLDSSVGKDEIEAGMSLIKERNKFLVSADSFGWDVALCYAKEPLAEDSEDERKIRRVKKEGKIRRDERLKSKLKPKRRCSALVKMQSPASEFREFLSSVPSIAVTSRHCKRPGHYVRFVEHLGLLEGFQTPISEELSCKDLSVFDTH